MTQIDEGAARSTGPSVQELLDADSRPVPAALRDHSSAYQGSADVPRSRYTSPAFAELERDYLWTRTWQFACTEDQLRQPGDHVVYDVADQSVIVTRDRHGAIRAYHNACLHRGTKLRVEDGRVGSFRCPFHGWRWDLEGNLAELPADWDFPQIRDDPTRSCLPEAAVATWCGFVFVNLAADPIPFERYADKLIEHFATDFGMADRYVAFHAVKEVPANWKVCMEAFSEAYHVIATHPQILEFCADANSEYSIWPESPYVTRFVNAFGVRSPHMGGLTEQQVADAYTSFFSRAGRGAVAVGDDEAARPLVADVLRRALEPRIGTDLSATSDAEVLDAVLYHLFPAFAPWAGIGQPLVYRWRPGATPDTCYMDVIRMAPVPDGAERPERAPMQVLTLDQPWKDAEGMGGLADVFEQDMANLPRVQAGLKSRGAPGVVFGRYQEARMRMLHRLIDGFVLDGLAADGRDAAEAVPFLVPEG